MVTFKKYVHKGSTRRTHDTRSNTETLVKSIRFFVVEVAYSVYGNGDNISLEEDVHLSKGTNDGWNSGRGECISIIILESQTCILKI